MLGLKQLLHMYELNIFNKRNNCAHVILIYHAGYLANDQSMYSHKTSNKGIREAYGTTTIR